jgi:hypothetical protein
MRALCGALAALAILATAACSGERLSSPPPVSSMLPITQVPGGIVSIPLEGAAGRTPRQVLAADDPLVAPWHAALEKEIDKIRIGDVSFRDALRADPELAAAWDEVRGRPLVGESDPLPSGAHRVVVEADLLPMLKIVTAREAR